MNNDINVIISLGPSSYDSDSEKLYKYATIGVKWKVDSDMSNSPNEQELLDDMILKIKDEFVKRALRPNTADDIDEYNVEDKFKKYVGDSGLINLTDAFFEYLKNNETKLEAIRVSLENYRQDYVEQKLKTLKTQMMVLTADNQSLDDMFSSLIKELYYEYGDKVIDIYSIILTPKQYKMVNNIPIEYRGLLVRVKK